MAETSEQKTAEATDERWVEQKVVRKEWRLVDGRDG